MNDEAITGQISRDLCSLYSLALIQHPIRIHSLKDLAKITELAQDRTCWRALTPRIEKAAEVSQTKNWDAKQQ